MEPSTPTELETIRGLVQGAVVSSEARSTALWCLNSLPALYEEFSRTHNVRQGDEARRLVEGMLMALPDEAVKARIAEELRIMHARLGLHVYKFAAAKPPRKRKADGVAHPISSSSRPPTPPPSSAER
jgi:hypothetical protein